MVMSPTEIDHKEEELTDGGKSMSLAWISSFLVSVSTCVVQESDRSQERHGLKMLSWASPEHSWSPSWGTFEQDGCTVQEAWATTRDRSSCQECRWKTREDVQAQKAKGEVSKRVYETRLDAQKSFSNTRLEKYPLLKTVIRPLKSLSTERKMSTVFRTQNFP